MYQCTTMKKEEYLLKENKDLNKQSIRKSKLFHRLIYLLIYQNKAVCMTASVACVWTAVVWHLGRGVTANLLSFQL